MRIVGSRLSHIVVNDFWVKLHSHLSSDGSEWCLAWPGATAQSTVLLHYAQPDDPDVLRDETLSANIDAAGALVRGRCFFALMVKTPHVFRYIVRDARAL